ncbi:ABC transporter [Nitrospira sp.]|nr:ABC transporter [Nitrospira sp.]
MEPVSHAAHHRASLAIRDVLARVGVLLGSEQRLLWLIVSYAVAIGLFSLIVPLTVQELVNTFAFAIEPITIVTLTAIIIAGLLFVGAFKAFQFYADELLQRRVFARVALGMTEHLPDVKVAGFKPRYANYFAEAVFMQRALSNMLIELIDVFIGGAVGMTLLVFYHPYFLGFNLVFATGGAVVIFVLSQGGLRGTVEVAHWKYDMMHWMQEISYNLLHFKSAISKPFLLKRTDALLGHYMAARRTRFAVLMRQYLGSVLWQALGQGGVIATAGWLLSSGELTLGQLVAAQVVVGNLIRSFEALVKKMSSIFYFFTALTELDFVFSLPKADPRPASAIPLPDPALYGVHLSCTNLGLRQETGEPFFSNLDLEVTPGEKVGILTSSQGTKKALARVLAGVESPTTGVVRYNGVDLRHVDMDSINLCRGFVLDSHMTLFEGTVEDNITLGRPDIPYSDLRWALRFAELEEDIDALPHGMKTSVRSPGVVFSTARILRILLARAIITRPQLLIIDGLLHILNPTHRETILRRLCAKEEPWAVVFVSNDPALIPYVDRQLVLEG